MLPRTTTHFFFFQAEDVIRVRTVTGVQTCALPISHFYNGAAELNFSTKNLRTFRRRENGSDNVQPNLAPVDVKGGHDLNVAWAVTADLPVHQPDASTVDGKAVVKIESLHKRAGAVSRTSLEQFPCTPSNKRSLSFRSTTRKSLLRARKCWQHAGGSLKHVPD